MTKAKGGKASKRPVTVKAKAVCVGFDIQAQISFTPKGLASFEVDDVKRKLKHQLGTLVAALPFAEVYPFEVKFR